MLCDRVGIIKDGCLLALDSVSQLRAEQGFQFKITYCPDSNSGESVTLYGADDQELVAKVQTEGIQQFAVSQTTLEDVYFAMTGGSQILNDR